MADEITLLDASSTLGIIATAILTVNFVLGLLLSTQYRNHAWWKRLPLRVHAWNLFKIHNWSAYLALVVATAHPVLLFLDKTAKFTWVDIIFPINSPHQSAINSLGALAFYGLLMVVLTSWGPVRRRLGYKKWKKLHFASYAVVPLFLVHGLLVDQTLKDKDIDFVDAEKVMSEAGILIFAAGVFFRIRARRRPIQHGYHKLRVVRVASETAAAKSFELLPPKGAESFFSFSAGQFLLFKVNLDDKQYKRCYSLACPPSDFPTLRVTVKAVEGGLVSKYLVEDLKEGDEVFSLPPAGSFYKEPPDDHPRHYVMFAGGSGITPIFSVICSALEALKNNRITLIYANRDPSSIIFKSRLERLVAQHRDRLSVLHVLDNAPAAGPYQQGPLNVEGVRGLVRPLSSSPENLYFICGPQGLINTVESVLLGEGIPPGRIHLEKFVSLASASDGRREGGLLTIESDAGAINAGRPEHVTIGIGGVRQEIDYHGEETILGAAIRAGLDVPYSCQEGACSSCKGVLVKGKVAMERHEGLTETDIEQRMILACQAKVLSRYAVVEFD